MQTITFESLPNAVSNLIGEVKELKKLIENSKQSDPEELLTRKQACELLNVTDVTLWKWSKQGKIKTYKIGNRIMLKRSEIIESISKNVTKK